jgi:hypothetical protein
MHSAIAASPSRPAETTFVYADDDGESNIMTTGLPRTPPHDAGRSRLPLFL